MADWLKINHRLIRSQKVWALADSLKVAFPHALGVALIWLTWVDEQTEDGQTGMTVKNMDAELRQRGAVSALVSIGWAGVDECGLVYAVDFSKHCGTTAKKRAETARRMGAMRARRGSNVTEKTSHMLHEKRHTCDEKNAQNASPEYNIHKCILSEGAAHADAAAPLEVETEEEAAAARKAEQEYLAALMQDLA
ncbi:MAG: hypothetical protein IKY91_04035 [Akkermansia sp.]|nr:hypothetical protein [Akkermansia sp.]